MTGRWFFSQLRHGVAAGVSASASVTPSVQFARHVDGAPHPVPVSGPALRLASADDVATIDAGLVWREEPPAGTPAAAENILASVEFSYADLPWILSTRSVRPAGGDADQPLPWLVLVVVSTDEAGPPRDADPAPLMTVPASALPPLDESWAWAHVEARLPDDTTPAAAAAAVADAARTRSGNVVARLMCPRKLEPNVDWIAAVIPVPSSGAWPAPAPGTTSVELRVFHWWRFSTGQGGSFEDLARRLKHADARALGLGSRTVDVRAPFPADARAAAEPTTVALDGALRVPGPPDTEAWSAPERQTEFRRRMTALLNAPAARHTAPVDGQPIDGEPADRDELAVGPPLYGSHHSGAQTVADDGSGWLTTLNLEVRRRVAASLGVRYVQLEQEFLMARAWEQVGEIREANRALAAAELAAAASSACRQKHIDPLAPVDLVTTMAPMAARVTLPATFMSLGASGDAGEMGHLAGIAESPDAAEAAGAAAATTADGQAPTLALALATSDLPEGMVTTAYSRLTRSTGAIARRAGRVHGGAHPDHSTLEGDLPMQPAGAAGLAGADAPMGLLGELTARTEPVILQLRRMADLVGSLEIKGRHRADARPLAPIMRHPHFDVAIGEELLARWPEWALPGITGIPEDSVVVLETNPTFIAALLVGLNHEFNRELLWREFPTDQRGTSFARFWPTPGVDVDEIATWPLDSELGSLISAGAEGSIVLVIRGEVLRRFPAAALVAIKGEGGRLPTTFDAGVPGLPMPLDDSTVLFLFSGVSEEKAIAEDWFFVLREPMRDTQFGFDLEVRDADGTPAADQGRMRSWADLTWPKLALDAGRYVRVQPPPPHPVPDAGEPQPADPAKWGVEAADMARIAFQQPFQLAFRARDWLG